MENFIRIWDNELPDHICDEIIYCFEKTLKSHPEIFQNEKIRSKNWVTNLHREDLSINLMHPVIGRMDLVNIVNNHIYRCLEEYKYIFGQIAFENYTTQNQFKIQRTMPLGAYHDWHYECISRKNMCLREVVWNIYLNDMPPHEAETEFLYQGMKIRPKKGSLCLFPAAMTHVHRGLTVYTQPKYIITGWFSKIIQQTESYLNHQQQLEFDFTERE